MIVFAARTVFRGSAGGVLMLAWVGYNYLLYSQT